jgi:hypothetical protein
MTSLLSLLSRFAHCQRHYPTTNGARHMKRATLVGLALLLCSVGQARADLILDFTGGSAGTAGNSETLGWRFTVTSPLTATSLGFWDEGSHTLVNSH